MKSSVPTELPPISIAMCTYNGERYLREQLDSLIGQDYPNLEIQIVDDHSADGSFRILEEYASNYPYLHIQRNERNIGFRANFEQALSLCTGKYISLCDQDDIWLSHKIRALYNAIDDNSLVYSEVQLIDESGRELDREYPLANRLEGHCHMGLLLSNCVIGHTSMFRRDLLEKALPIPDNVKMHDHWLAFVAAAAGGIKVLREKLSLYRQHDSNAVLSSSKSRRPSKSKRRLASYQERIGFVNAAASLDWLPMEDLKLIGEVRAALLKYPYCYRNRKLHNLLLKNCDVLLAKYLDPEQGLRRLTRGYFSDLF